MNDSQIQELIKLRKKAMYKKDDGNNLYNLPQKEYMQYYRACKKMFPDIQLNDLDLDTVLSEIDKNK